MRLAAEPKKQGGQALVMLLAFMAIALTLTTAATSVTIANTQATSEYELGQDALSIAETGIDNAILRLLRDPTYTGETLNIGNGTVTITVSGSPNKTITSRATSGGFVRNVQAVVNQSGNVLTLTSWAESP